MTESPAKTAKSAANVESTPSGADVRIRLVPSAAHISFRVADVGASAEETAQPLLPLSRVLAVCEEGKLPSELVQLHVRELEPAEPHHAGVSVSRVAFAVGVPVVVDDDRRLEVFLVRHVPMRVGQTGAFREAFPFLVLGDEVHEKGVPVLAEHDAGVLVDPNHHSSIRRIVAVRMRGRPVPASVGRDGAVGHDVYRNGISG